MNAYVYGDWTAENAARRLGVGRDQITLGFDGARGKIDENTKGYTQANGKGGRTIFLKDGGTEPGALLNMAVTLQHEAYRSGVAGGAKTYEAVLAHTAMAAALLHDKQTGFMDKGLVNDINAYSNGEKAFREYTGETYDSSSEYWKAVMTDRGVGWISDGKTTFDVSDVIEGGGTALANLDQATIQQLWQLQQGVVSGTIAGGAAISDAAGVFYHPEFANYDAFFTAMQQYNIASQRINSTMGLFVVNNKGKIAPEQALTQNSLISMMDALQTVQDGGLLVKTDSTLADAGPGRSIFALGGNGTWTSDYGYRPENWLPGVPIKNHTGWDVSLGTDTK